MQGRRILLIASLLTAGLTVSACDSIGDPSDWFNPKKPLPGERKEMFPGGVPGVPEGVPPDLVKGYQPPAEPPPQVAQEQPAAAEKPKPKPKPKPLPKHVAAPVSRTPAAPPPAQAQSPWPSPQPSAAQPAWPNPQASGGQAAPSQSVFPDPPPPR